MSARRVPVAPRMVTRAQAAAYCGLSAPDFSAVCPVPAVSLADDRRFDRYDLRQIDAWLDTRTGAAPSWSRPTMAELMRDASGRAN